MLHLKERKEEVGVTFQWGIKRGTGGRKEDVQFYQSFTYDGMEYFLYDCVFMYRNCEVEPDIGMLVKIWEAPDQKKKVKVVWFFRPTEIQNWLEGVVPHHNELFLACGEGQGLSNINPLGAICGKCNVVCISKDKRNPQASDEALKMADFLFFRMFDVKDCKILENFPDKIAGVEVACFFNKKEEQNLVATFKFSEPLVEGSGKSNPLKRNLVEVTASAMQAKSDSGSLLLKESKKDVDSLGVQACRSAQVEPLRSFDEQMCHADGNTATKFECTEASLHMSGSDDRLVKKRRVLDSLGNHPPELKHNGSLEPEGVYVPKNMLTQDAGFNSVSLKTCEPLLRSNGTKQINSLGLKKSCFARTKVDEKATKVFNEHIAQPEKCKSLETESRPDGLVKQQGTATYQGLNKIRSMGMKVDEKATKVSNEHIAQPEKCKSLETESRLDGLIKQQGTATFRGLNKSRSMGMKVDEKVTMVSNEAIAQPDGYILPESESRFGGRTKQQGTVSYQGLSKSRSTEMKVDDKATKLLSDAIAKPEMCKSSAFESQLDVLTEQQGTMTYQGLNKIRSIGMKVDKKATKVSGEAIAQPEKFKFPETQSQPDGLFKQYGTASCQGLNKICSMETKVDEKATKVFNEAIAQPKKYNPRTESQFDKITHRQGPKSCKMEGQYIEAAEEPDNDTCPWLKPRSWEERMQNADKERTLVSLENLDPSYTSSDIKNIIHQMFNEKVDARMTECSTFASRCYGQAFIIFRTKTSADSVISDLNESYLLVDGRPLIARRRSPTYTTNPIPYSGHLVVNNARQKQRETVKTAVSTSHCSQPNTIEYEMGVEWQCLQQKSDLKWTALEKKQAKETEYLRSQQTWKDS